jgi:polyvinyl alcohol dehydrogenase (cytochrome)
MVSGAMRLQASRVSGAERRAIAEYLTGRKIGFDVKGSAVGRCAIAAKFDFSSGPLWNGWGPTLANARFQTAEQAGLTAQQLPQLKFKWAIGFPDATSAWSQPAVAGGRVFVGSHNGTVFSLDAKTGCSYWTFGAAGGVRTGIALAPKAGGGYAVYFGSTSATVYALDAETGKQLWSRKVEDHPLARTSSTPVVYQNRLYIGVASYEEVTGANPDYECCTFRGSLVSLDARSGAIVWKTYTSDMPKPRGKGSAGATLWGPSGAGVWSSPTIDAKRDLVYAATGNTYSPPQLATSDAVIAFDLKRGAIRWINQVTPEDVFVSGCRPESDNPNCRDKSGPDFDFGNSPILTTTANGKDIIVIGQKSGVGYAMDPDQKGKMLWQYRAGRGSSLGGMEWGSAADGQNAYFPVSDINLPDPGGLHAVNLVTGERAWYAPPRPLKCSPNVRGCNGAQSAAVTVIPGAVFSGANDGVLRAFSTRDGSLIWEYDTNREFPTANGVPAQGASMIGPGPAVAGGMVFFNSGYAGYGGRSGNAFVALGLE